MNKCHSRNIFFHWPNVYYSPTSFLTFFIFIFTSCALEATVTPFLHKYHCSLQHWLLVQISICQTFSVESNSKFSRNSTLILESFTRLSILVTSTSVSPVHYVIISQTKSILAFGAAVKSINALRNSFMGWCKINQWQWFFYLIRLTGWMFLWGAGYKGSFLFTTFCKIFTIKA